MNLAGDGPLDGTFPAQVGEVSLDRRRTMIAEAAYFRAQARGFEVGGELDDWLEAEFEVDQLLAEHGFGTPGFVG
jgi:hypothetical protein